MYTPVIINATGINEYALTPLWDDESSFSLMLKFADDYCGGAPILIIANPGSDLPHLPEGILCSRKAFWTMGSLLEEADLLFRTKPGYMNETGSHPILYLQADSPFTDRELCDKLLDIHIRYRAEYTYADGYSPGFSPEIIAARTVPNLVDLARRHHKDGEESERIPRDALFSLIQKDMNAFDIETELCPLDLRAYRFSPTCDTRRNRISAMRLRDEGVVNAQKLVETLPSRPDLLRSLPAFLWVQVAANCPQACSYCPYPKMGSDLKDLDPREKSEIMPVDRFRKLMDMAEELCDDLVVDISLWGEASRHPEIFDIADAALSKPRFSLIIETSGIGWGVGLAERIMAIAPDRLDWIISLDDENPKGYEALRGEGRDEAFAFARHLASVNPRRVHIQAVRMKDNEEGLEAFYRGWKKITENVIIQKYDSFAGCLPDRTVTDLSPLERNPCRHLARDMAVLLDGSVPACKHSLIAGDDGILHYQEILGNVFIDGLPELWKRQNSWYERHIDGNYPSACRSCNEYHTYNA